MSNIKYLIRQNDFAYNDEWHLTNYVSTGAIKQIYTDKAEAEKAYKSLVSKAYTMMNYVTMTLVTVKQMMKSTKNLKL